MFDLNYLKYMRNSLESPAFTHYPKLKNIKKFLDNLSGSIFVRMTGSGSALVAYFRSKKICEKAKKNFTKNIKIVGVWYQKLYKFYFLCYTKLMMGRSQAVRHGFLVPAS